MRKSRTLPWLYTYASQNREPKKGFSGILDETMYIVLINGSWRFHPWKNFENQKKKNNLRWKFAFKESLYGAWAVVNWVEPWAFEIKSRGTEDLEL